MTKMPICRKAECTEQQGIMYERARSDREDLTAEVNRSFLSSGQRQEQSGRLARNSLCLGVWDYSSKFTQSASDWQAAEEGEAIV